MKIAGIEINQVVIVVILVVLVLLVFNSSSEDTARESALYGCKIRCDTNDGISYAGANNEKNSCESEGKRCALIDCSDGYGTSGYGLLCSDTNCDINYPDNCPHIGEACINDNLFCEDTYQYMDSWDGLVAGCLEDDREICNCADGACQCSNPPGDEGYERCIDGKSGNPYLCDPSYTSNGGWKETDDCRSDEMCIFTANAAFCGECEWDSECPSGHECIAFKCEEVEFNCQDSDGGPNEHVKGTVEYGPNYENSDTDYCTDSDTVKEYTCGNTDSDYEYIDCGQGEICEEGACVTEECTDDWDNPPCGDYDSTEFVGFVGRWLAGDETNTKFASVANIYFGG